MMDSPTTYKPPNIRGMLWLSAAVLAVMLLMSAYAWVQIPDGTPIPVHWNAAGEADGYGGKFEALLLVPLITAGIALLFAAIPRIDPRGENILRSWPAFRALWLTLLVFMLGLQVALVLTALGRPINIGTLIPAGVGLMFIVIGNYMGKIRQNYMVGVRTPWTITSELSWNKTHRLTGFLFVGLGLLMILTSFMDGEAWVWVMIVAIFAVVAIAFGYSYLVWRDDPDREVKLVE